MSWVSILLIDDKAELAIVCDRDTATVLIVLSQVPAPVNISVKRLKFRLPGSARKSQKRFRDTPRFKFLAVFVRVEPFQRSNERSEWGDHPI
jgi:hypothetical protein